MDALFELLPWIMAAGMFLLMLLGALVHGVREARRAGRLQALAEEHGLQYQRHDDGVLLAHRDLALLRRGNHQRLVHLLHASADDAAVVAGDLVWRSGSGQDATTSSSTICLLRHPKAELPPLLLLERASLTGHRRFGRGAPVDLSADPVFDARYVVLALDAEQAQAAVDAQLRAWCLAQEPAAIECNGRACVVDTGDRLPPEALPGLMRASATGMAQLIRSTGGIVRPGGD